MKKSEVTGDWSRLSSSSKFDPGKAFGRGNIIPTSRAFTHSLFVESLIEQLSRLLEKDPKRQRKIYLTLCSKLRDMSLVGESYLQEELSSLRDHYGQALNSMVRRPHQFRMPPLETSRYATEFEEISWIASGGFGQVYRAKNRLDEIEYAVKKIKVRLKDVALVKRTLSEVKTFARLNHPNIVQYKGAWLEMATLTQKQSLSAIESSDLSDAYSDGDDSCADSSTDDLLALCPVSKSRVQTESGATLYVCMQLCNETLRQWLDRRNSMHSSIDISLALHMIQQAARGIAYIHASNVVHHDIKPSNVFITSDLRVQVGDFGLACALGGGECPVAAGHGGTRLYAAPEQRRRQCHLRSDMFSLGLVLIELLCPFSTDMERASVLGKARERHLPDQLPLQMKELLEGMLAGNPNRRPDAVELLNELHDLRLFYAANELPESESADNQLKEQTKQTAVESEEELAVGGTTLVIDQTKTELVSTAKTESGVMEDTIDQLRADLQRVTTESAKTISNLRDIEAEHKKTIERLLKTEASNDDAISQLRKMVEERDDEIRKLRSCLRHMTVGSSCAEEYRAHSA